MDGGSGFGGVRAWSPSPRPLACAWSGLPLAAVGADARHWHGARRHCRREPPLDHWLNPQGRCWITFCITETLTRATPLIFTGLAVAVAFRAKLWNIGAEAQLYAARSSPSLRHGAIAFAGASALSADLAGRDGAGALLCSGRRCSRCASASTRWSRRCCSTSSCSVRLDAARRAAQGPIALGWPQSSAMHRRRALAPVSTGMRLHSGFVLGARRCGAGLAL